MKCEGWEEIWPNKFARCVLEEHGEEIPHFGEVITRFSKPKTQVNYNKWKAKHAGRASHFTS